MDSIPRPELTEIKILVQPAKDVAVNQRFEHPIVVMVKFRGLTTTEMKQATLSL